MLMHCSNITVMPCHLTNFTYQIGSTRNFELFSGVITNLKNLGALTKEMYYTIIDGFHKCDKDSEALAYFEEMKTKFPIGTISLYVCPNFLRWKNLQTGY
jgi:hypothetical protein